MAESLVYTIINQKGKPSVIEVGGSSVGPRGVRGQDGRQGVDGAPGQAATVRVGTVTEGDWPDVINSGTSQDAIFDFVLARGPKGNTGSVGPVGPQGRTSTIQVGTVTSGPTPAVLNVGTNTDAIFNFTLAKGDTGDQGPTGDSGVYLGTEEPTDPDVNVWVNPNGTVTDFKGDKGDPGEAATITIGTVTSGAVPSVTNSGTSTDAILDFVLVPGQNGTNGRDGQDGVAATIAVGTVTSGQVPSITNSGSSTNAVFDFVLPKGDKGDTGNAATIAVGSVTSGSTASVTNSGTSSAAVFDFILPKGDPGEGVPSGGSAGQILVKTSGSDYSTAWANPSSNVSYVMITGTRDTSGSSTTYFTQTAYFGCSAITDPMAVGEMRTIDLSGSFSGNIINWTLGSGTYTVIPKAITEFYYNNTRYYGTAAGPTACCIREFGGGQALIVAASGLLSTGNSFGTISILRTA